MKHFKRGIYIIMDYVWMGDTDEWGVMYHKYGYRDEVFVRSLKNVGEIVPRFTFPEQPALPSDTHGNTLQEPLQEQEAPITLDTEQRRWAENLILQLPEEHEGRNSWLLTFGKGPEAKKLREEFHKKRGVEIPEPE